MMKTNKVRENICSEKNLPILGTVHPDNFIEYMGFFAKSGTNFEQYLEVVDKYFQNTPSLEVKLILENALYGCFLKHYQSEYCFNEFFKVMQKFHSQKPKKHIQ